MNKQTFSSSTDKANLSSGKGADSIADSVQTLVDQGAETLGTIKSRVTEVTDEARTQGVRAYDRTTELVQTHPLKSLAIAFGIGYVAMRVTTSKLTSIAMIAGVIYAGSRLVRSGA